MRLLFFVITFICFSFQSEGKWKSNLPAGLEWNSYDDSYLIKIRYGYEQRRVLAFEQLRSKPLVREARS